MVATVNIIHFLFDYYDYVSVKFDHRGEDEWAWTKPAVYVFFFYYTTLFVSVCLVVFIIVWHALTLFGWALSSHGCAPAHLMSVKAFSIQSSAIVIVTSCLAFHPYFHIWVFFFPRWKAATGTARTSHLWDAAPRGQEPGRIVLCAVFYKDKPSVTSGMKEQNINEGCWISHIQDTHQLKGELRYFPN